MATTKVIATTWAKKDLLKKLNETLKRMDAEIVEWDKNYATLEKRQKAWDKKACDWARKNISKAEDVDTSTRYNRFELNFSFDSKFANDALGERPSNEQKPDYKNTSYNKDVSDYDQVRNAIALIEGSTDTEFKITTSSVWASFIR